MVPLPRLASFSLILLGSTLAVLAETPTAPSVQDAPTTPEKPATSAVSEPSPTPDFAALLAKAQAGDAHAELDVTMAYYNGRGVAQDYRQAYNWSLESAIQGNATGESNVGNFYDKGLGVHQNQAKAFQWAMKAARHGNSACQRAVGIRLQYGMGVARNYMEGVAWLRQAAIQGEPEAESRLGDYLMNTTDPDKDLEQGFAFLVKSSKSFPFSRYIVGKCYANGLFVPSDLVRAYAWELIAPATDKRVQDLLAGLKMKMTVDQIKEATAYSAHLLNQTENGNFQSDDLKVGLANGPVDTVPYADPVGYILIPVTLQSKEQVYFMIDTGCDISIIDARAAKRLNLTGTEYLPMSGIGRDIGLSTLADNVSITGSGLNISGARLAILPDFDEYLGHPLAGILGTDLLTHYVVRIEYTKKTITFALTGQLPEDPKAGALPMTLNYNSPMIQASVGVDQAKPTEGTFLIDTGDRGAFSLTKAFQDYNPRLEVTKAVRGGSIGFGGIEWTTYAKSGAGLGDFHLPDAIMALAEDRQGNWVDLNGGDIGDGIWDRFEVTLDFPAHKLFLQPNAKFSHPFDFPYSGVGIKTTGGDYRTFVVYQVVPDSPGAAVGLQIGDQILQVDNQSTSGMTMDDLYDHLKNEGSHQIQYRRDGKDTSLMLPIYDPFKHPDQIAVYRKSAPPATTTPKIQSFSVQYIGCAPLYPDDVIVRATGLKVGDVYLPFTANRALKSLYATGLFENAGLHPETSAGGINLGIIIQPNPLVKTISSPASPRLKRRKSGRK